MHRDEEVRVILLELRVKRRLRERPHGASCVPEAGTPPHTRQGGWHPNAQTAGVGEGLEGLEASVTRPVAEEASGRLAQPPWDRGCVRDPRGDNTWSQPSAATAVQEFRTLLRPRGRDRSHPNHTGLCNQML